ncbi:hypothetical protein CAPTEDRAFT_141038 [Capitella teleta]|uniref:Nucleolar complex protein 2 homolog n=1 Tax=Capitella teleta TaxID=283909 RepID=R7UUM3_CAPTE|nr:hypothetical protein CAPTEDRAFT_141038 [Capitella teleta]|eukprot:ELU07056.1 hypothetical protein CAPTEDRAFT_141038 [Capitella teleta]
MPTEHKKSLSKLQEKDPEFYEFLQKESADLLEFDMEGEEEEESGEDEGSGEEEEEEEEEDSGEEEEEEEEDKKPKKPAAEAENKTDVTEEMVAEWVDSIRNEDSIPALKQLVSAFTAAVHQVAQDDDEGPTQFRVRGTLVFNAIVRGCLKSVFPALQRLLQLTRPEKEKEPLPSKGHGWRKMSPIVKRYMTDLVKFLKDLGEASVLSATLKHVLLMAPYVLPFPKICKALLRNLIRIWSTAESEARLIAFLALNKTVRLQRSVLLAPTLKQMYMAYVSNCKFTSPRTLPLIKFMQASLVELLLTDSRVAYQLAFVYVRQLAVHLRSALTIKKEEKLKAVYNWQFMHSLHLWALLLCSAHPNPILEPLIYPVTQVAIGCIKLNPTAQYVPLRLHCARVLNMLSSSTHTYIPVLPFLLEVFTLIDFNKKPKNAQLKPFFFRCLLRFSKTEMCDRAFKDGVMENTMELMWDHLNIHAHTLAFPEIILPAQVQLKKFTKICKVPNYCKQVKTILTKMEENSRTITQRRRTANLGLADTSAVNTWESRSKEQKTPLGKYYVQWKQMRDKQLQKMMQMALDGDRCSSVFSAISAFLNLLLFQ